MSIRPDSIPLGSWEIQKTNTAEMIEELWMNFGDRGEALVAQVPGGRMVYNAPTEFLSLSTSTCDAQRDS